MNHPNRAVFLDRDGVINVEKGYLHRIEELEFIPGAAEAIKLLKDAGYLVIVVTNQSGVARGYYSLEAVELLHRHMQRELAACGAVVDGWYVCPHHPEHDGPCSCRKPLPGMIEQAAVEYRIDLAQSYLIGDKQSDLEAGLAAGCRSMLVGTGYGADRADRLPDGVQLFSDLLEAARAIVGEEGPAS